MAKQVTKTPAIVAQMQKIAGEGVDVSNLPVWEAQAANTLPLSKRGSIYDKARMSEGMVSGIADYVNAKGLPLHTLHQQGSELPVGKVFMAGTVPDDTGLPQTNLLFYTQPDASDLINSLDTGVIDSVSLGVLSEHALCSECGFDYFGDDVDAMNFWDRVCAEGHVVGEDGVYLNLTGVDGVYELSLVSTGAVQNSKIVGGSKAVVSQASAARLAASGLDPSAVILRASTKIATSKERPMADNLQLDSLVDKYTNAKVELAGVTGKLTVADAQVVALSAQVTALSAENVVLKAAAAADPAGTVAKLAAAEADVKVAIDFLRAQATKALVATNGDVSKATTMTIAELSATISGAQATLATLFPAGGKTAVSLTTEDAEAVEVAARRASFKTRA